MVATDPAGIDQTGCAGQRASAMMHHAEPKSVRMAAHNAATNMRYSRHAFTIPIARDGRNGLRFSTNALFRHYPLLGNVVNLR